LSLRSLLIRTAGRIQRPPNQAVSRERVVETAFHEGYSWDTAESKVPNVSIFYVPESGEPVEYEDPQPQPEPEPEPLDGSDSGTDGSDSDTEPLDDEADDYYGLQTEIASDSGLIENSHYTDGGTPVTAQEAVGRYIGSRNG